MAKTKIVTPSEADLENYGTQLLELDGWRSLKTDPVRNREWGKGFGEPGMADRQYLRYDCDPQSALYEVMNENDRQQLRAAGEILWIEWKRLKGKAEAHQLAWIRLERKRGALVWLAGKDFTATPEGFYAHYKASGLMRKQISAPGR